MGVTQQRATCLSCLEAGQQPIGTSSFLKAGGFVALGLLLLFALVVYLAGG
jgi:hypothetical protein